MPSRLSMLKAIGQRAIDNTLGKTKPIKAMQRGVQKYAEAGLRRQRREQNIAADRKAIKEIDASNAASRRSGGLISAKTNKTRSIVENRLKDKKNY